MSKKLKVLVAVLMAILLLTAGGTAAVMADDESTSMSNATSTNSLLARVADKLGITEEELANAFREARQEIREEAFISYLDKAVAEGLITQQEADKIKEWWGQRPGAFERLSPRRFLGKGLLSRHICGAQRGWSEQALNQAMERGLIGEEKANQIMERWQNRLETQNRLFSCDRIRQATRVQQAAGPMGWQWTGAPELAD